MQRQIIRIDEDLCNGCGECVPNCAEGALQVIDGKVRLISDLLCDGLGACLGHCPVGAISVETREAEPYDEARVITQMVSKGRNTVVAHLRHLKDHGQHEYLQQGIAALRACQLDFDLDEALASLEPKPKAFSLRPRPAPHLGGGCPGSRSVTLNAPGTATNEPAAQPSALGHWPIQLHLINPAAPYFQGAHLLVAADCVPFALAGFHQHLRGKALVIGCPKLDSRMEVYVDKLQQMIDGSNLQAITVMIMEVPCCGGLVRLVHEAQGRAKRYVPVTLTTVGIRGEIINTQPV